jgi:crotonobetainyl-CoA:carnitine CoA-transferase CaiB-like acyl-CoA transferase
MLTATVFQSEQIAEIAVRGERSDAVGADLHGPSATCRLYEATDGWIVISASTPPHRAALANALGITEVTVTAIQGAVGALTTADACARLAAHGVPAAISVHPSAVPDDPQVIARRLLTAVGHPVAGRFVQVGIPLRLSVDTPAVKGSAPAPGTFRRQVKARA